MNDERYRKVKASHLARDAYLYVRQATCSQGCDNAKRLQRQYHLKQQAVALGWPAERVITIGSDRGQSAASTTDRPGFQELVRQVRRGGVGVVMALNPSRLTRNVLDWHHLLDMCAMSDTLLLDQDRLYDPGDCDDRVLLGCNPTMSAHKSIEMIPQQKEALT
jgi:DNA invertase Pin-like site-specific DNA recombinase